MKKCTKSLNAKHLWGDKFQADFQRKENRRNYGFSIFSNEIVQSQITRKLFPQCSLCGVVDTTKKPEIVVEHDSYNTDDLLFD